MRRRLIAVSAAVAAATLAGCFTTTSDFRADAEDFIESDSSLRTALFADSGVVIDSATCAEPENQNEGTTFACTALDSDGDTWEFEVAITGDNEYEVNLSRSPG